VVVSVTANAFLYHMVRNIVGALRRVGFGQADPEWMRALLEAKNRHLAGRMAPAHGLYLERVEYASRFRLPDLADFLVPGGK
jgi:tRNA pseudouridine38-40 synthase